MKWGRHKDYHGSRSYEPEVAQIGQFGLLVAWSVSIAKGRLRKMWKFAAPPTAPEILVRDGERHFSLIGGKPQNRLADCPFPTNPRRPHNPRDSRVFP
jgi:hypothetical protein